MVYTATSHNFVNFQEVRITWQYDCVEMLQNKNDLAKMICVISMIICKIYVFGYSQSFSLEVLAVLPS